MARSTDLNRYPPEYFKAIEIAARDGEFVIPCENLKHAKSVRLDFFAIRKGCEDQQFQPYNIFVKDLRFIATDTQLILRKSDRNNPVSAAVAAYKPSPSKPSPGAVTAIPDPSIPDPELEFARKRLAEQGVKIDPNATQAEKMRTADELLMKLLKGEKP